MSKGTLSFAALLLLFVGFPVAGMVVAGHSKTKKDKSFHREFYPDDHLFI